MDVIRGQNVIMTGIRVAKHIDLLKGYDCLLILIKWFRILANHLENDFKKVCQKYQPIIRLILNDCT